MTARTSEFVRVTLALALFLFAWAALHVGFYEHDQIVDTPVYEEYGSAMEDGELPYRDFDVEYPPAALPVFAVPALIGDDYRTSFEWLMALCGGGTIIAVALSARRLSLGFGTLAFVALAPLLLGSVMLSRFDLWPSMLASFALAALLHDRFRLGHGLLGTAVVAKIYPGVFLPLALAYVWRRRGRREALVCAGIFAAVVLAVYLPFLVIAPGGVASSLGRQLSRPLQIESLGSAVLLGAHDLLGVDVEMHSSHGSQNLSGTGTGAAAVVLSLVQVAVLVWLWVRFARRAATPAPAELAVACAAVLATFVALGKVLSPQFLIWLVPVVPLAARFGANALLAAALVLTQLWFPYRYWDLARDLDPNVAWLVLARDVVLVALVVVLARAVTARDLPGARHRARLEWPLARRPSTLPERR